MSELSWVRKLLIIVTLLVILLLVSSLRAQGMNSEMLVDPTRPLDRQGVLSGDEELGADQFRFLEKKYTVDSILIKPNIKIAVVNAKRVGLGDTIDGASVVAIERGQVTLEVSGERRVIQLRQDVIKTNARK